MVTKRKLTVQDVFTMGETGVIAPDERVELIDGELYTMTPPSSQHAGHVDWLSKRLERTYGDRAIVRTQNPLTLGKHRLLEPDLALAYPKASLYLDAHPTAEDIFLAVEVSLSSLAFDKERKLPAYAEAGVPELWIVDVERGQTEVYWEPLQNSYRHRSLVSRNENVAPKAFSEVGIFVFPQL